MTTGTDTTAASGEIQRRVWVDVHLRRMHPAKFVFFVAYMFSHLLVANSVLLPWLESHGVYWFAAVLISVLFGFGPLLLSLALRSDATVSNRS